MKRKSAYSVLGLVALMSLVCMVSAESERHEPIVPQLTAASALMASTIPDNGDVNPYGVAFVPRGFPADGLLSPGDIVVSNFNNSANIQGAGTTIVSVNPSGQTSLFFQGSGLGLTTALGVLRRGFVLVGSVPTTDGTCNTIGNTSLLILDAKGSLVTNLSDPNLLAGPWDLTIHDQGELAQVFVSNVLNGTVTRIDLRIPMNSKPVVAGMTRIGSGYGQACNTAAVVVGPTGLAYDAPKDILYVASTSDNKIFALPHARKTTRSQGTGSLVYEDNVHLHGPLALVLAPNGNLITANGDAVNGDPSQPSELVEFTPAGHFVAQFSVDSAQGGAFGMALHVLGNQVRFATVDDVTNVLDIWKLE